MKTNLYLKGMLFFGAALVPAGAGAQTVLPQSSAFSPAGLAVEWALALLIVPFVAWRLARRSSMNRMKTPGFEMVTPSEKRVLIPLEEKYQQLDYVARVPTRGQLRLSGNLNKVSLSIRRYGYLLEDKNFRNALLVNRRRVRRTLLKNGDVLDLGDMILLYRDNRDNSYMRHSAMLPEEGKTVVKFHRSRGPVRAGTPMLVPELFPTRIFYLTKNMVYIGRSETNDLVVKSNQLHFRHAKIERVGSKWKLMDLAMAGSTFVNNRRVEQKFLKEGDDISLDTLKFKFMLAPKNLYERQPPVSQPVRLKEGDVDEELPESSQSSFGDEAELQPPA
ncbi:MAG: FHA domain-containing protein [Deltaproteobacteria bacterium]|nr:FHA domain-containing protein [Deltaproteobacteria bacterium]